MDKIVISDDKSLESLEIRFDHLLLNEEELKQEKERYKPLSDLLDNVPDDFIPTLMIQGKDEKIAEVLEGNDELELYFMIMILKDRTDMIFDKLKSLKTAICSEKYLDLLIFFLLHDKDRKEDIISEIKSLDNVVHDGVTDLIISAYSNDQHDVKVSESLESYAASFFEAVKAETAGETGKAFSIFLDIFERSGYHPFIFEILKLFLVRYDNIDPGQINSFVGKIGESSLNVSYSNLKFLEFLYYYRNKIEDQLEETVSALAESTDSLFILSVIVPVLFKYEKWHLVGKYYKLVGRKTTGGERTKYLELLADIYENKLDMPDFATEIHKTIVEDDPMNCSVSLSRVLSVYEENRQWNDLCTMYRYLAQREEDDSLKAYYLYKAGDIIHRELNKSVEAKDMLEKSLSLNYSFEVVRTLSEIYLKLHDYDSYLETLIKELEFSLDKNERVRILNIIAETYMDKKKDLLSAEKYLLNILEISPDHLPTVKRLGKIYYKTRSWKKLTEINTKEISLIEDVSEKVNLLYKNGCLFFKELGNLENASDSFMKILEIETDHVPSLLYLEKIYLRRKDFNNLIVLYKKLLQSSGADSETRQYYLTRLAIIYRDNDMIPEAIQMFTKVLELFPDNIMAKENLRMLKNEADFSPVSSEDFNDREVEIFAELQKGGDRKVIAEEYLKRNENSFWKYLYFLKSDDEVLSKLPEKMSKDEKFTLSLITGEFSVENLLKNSSKRIALNALLEKYVEQGYYRGIYTLLKYYLSFEPEHKRKVWAVFFRGQDNPELKEDLENILVKDTDNTYFDIVREVLEKLYAKEENYSTIIFLRTAFSRKIEDLKERCDFIDRSINDFADKADPDQMIELYKLRLKSTPDEELEAFSEKYINYLEAVGKTGSVISVIDELWEKRKNPVTGLKLFNVLSDSGNVDRAIEVAKDTLRVEWNEELFQKVISLHKERGEYDAAIAELNLKIESGEAPEIVDRMKEMLTDIHISAGYVDSAEELFKNGSFSDASSKFEKGFDLAKLFEKSGYKDKAVELVKDLNPGNEEQAIRKIKFLLESGQEFKEEHLISVDSFYELEKVLGTDVIDPHRDKLIDHFAQRGDMSAARELVARLIKYGKKEEAASKLESFKFDSYDNAVFLSKISSIDEDSQKESNMLRSVLFKSLIRKDPYPSERLYELEKKNKKTTALMKCFLDAVKGDDDIDISTGLASINKSELFKITEFDETDVMIREYASILALGGREGERTDLKPIEINSNRTLFNLLEEIRMATGFEDVQGVWDDHFQGVFEVIPTKIPSFVFGEKTMTANWNTVKFDIIRNAFFIESGMKRHSGVKGLEDMIENVTASFKLEGKEKVRFIKNLKPALQNRMLELFNDLEAVPDEKISIFIKKLYEASFFHTFSFYPDIKAIPVYIGEPLTETALDNPKFKKLSDFVFDYFFDKGA